MLHVVHGAQGIGDVGESHKLGVACEVGLKHLAVQGAVFVQFHHQNVEALLQRKHLPWHDVAVVLHPGEDDAIASAEVGTAPGLGHEVDAIGRAAHKQDFLCRRRTDVGAHRLTCCLVGLRGLLCQGVHASVDVAVGVREIARLRIDDLLRLVRRRGTVEVGERLAVHLP